ncbi:MAG: DUF3597 family protein, partial [Acidobacteria bacterium]|nr:DUF3597 family protein [Acidobacteriota bacterium]
MGLFSVLMQKVFHAGAGAEAPKDVAHAAPESRVQAADRQNVPVAIAVPGAPSAPGSQPSTPGSFSVPAPGSSFDVGANLDKLAAGHHEKLDWKHSIVDLMKLVGM